MPEVVLVGEEVRHAVVRDVLPEHRLGRGRPAVQRVRPVLDPDPPADARMRERGDVAAGVHVRVAGAQAAVGDHAVVDLEPGRGREIGGRPDADADDREVGRDLLVGVEDRVREVAADVAELAQARAEPEVDAVRGVQVAEDRRHLVAEDPAQRQEVDLDDGHVAARRHGPPPRSPARSSRRRRPAPARRLANAPAARRTARSGAGSAPPAGPRRRCRGVRTREPGRQQQLVVRQPTSRRPARRPRRPGRPRWPRRPSASSTRCSRTTRRRARTPCPAAPCRAGSPWTAAGARTAGRSPRRPAPPARRSPRRAASRPPSHRPATPHDDEHPLGHHMSFRERKETIVATTRSRSAASGRWKAPSSGTNRASGRPVASWRPPANGTSRSPR